MLDDPSHQGTRGTKGGGGLGGGLDRGIKFNMPLTKL